MNLFLALIASVFATAVALGIKNPPKDLDSTNEAVWWILMAVDFFVFGWMLLVVLWAIFFVLFRHLRTDGGSGGSKE